MRLYRGFKEGSRKTIVIIMIKFKKLGTSFPTYIARKGKYSKPGMTSHHTP